MHKGFKHRNTAFQASFDQLNIIHFGIEYKAAVFDQLIKFTEVHMLTVQSRHKCYIHCHET